MKLLHFLLVFFAALALASCTGNPYGDAYNTSSTRTIQQVRTGVIQQTEPVTIDGDSNVIGTVAGAAIGGILGSSIGGGKGSDIAAVGGGVVGAAAGNKASQAISRKNGVNLTIKMDDTGEVIAIVQEANPNMIFSVGQRVRVNIDGRTARVVPE